jgi:uncharacterized protein (TIGR02246 family)
MTKPLHRCVLAIALTTAGLLLLQACTEILPQPQASAQQPKAAASTDDEIVKPIVDLAKSYNAKDAKAFALPWTEKAEYVDEDTGERLDGRKAIVDDFAETFAKNENVRVEIDITKVRRLGDSAAAVEGTTRVIKPKTPVARTKFLALLVRQDGNWLVDNVRESRIESDNPNAEMLEPLNWLIGTWTSKDGDDEVSMECSEVANGNFLTVRFKVKSKDDTTLEGTTIIGWDAAQKQLHTWVFSSDGSFGKGVIENSGDRWTIRVSGTLPSGERSAATQIVTRKDDTHFTFESTDRTVGTRALPNGSVITLTKTTGKG